MEWTDKRLEAAWECLGDVPLNYDEDGECTDPFGTERLDEDFYFEDELIFGRYTEKLEVWHWFDEMHSKGLGYIMWGSQ
jgi:hypothetical protein